MRLREIDGLRGWAAVSVVVFHMLQQTFATVQPGICPPVSWFFMDGPMAVYIFLILSGDALSTAYVSDPARRGLERLIAKRYFRLTIPIALTILATYGIMKAGWVYNQQAAVILNRGDWLGTFLTFTPHFTDAARYALNLVFSTYGGPNNWNTFLWTMPVEMYGSLLVFAYMHLVHRLRRPLLTTLALVAGLGFLSQYYALFLLGVLLAQLRAAGWLERVRGHFAGWVGSSALLAASFWFEWASHAFAPPPAGAGGMLAVVNFILAHREHILAGMIVAGCYGSVPMLWFLRSAISRLMGRLSFAIYLVQFPVICSFESWLVIRYQAHLGSMNWVLGMAGVSLGVAMLAAECVTRLDNLLLGWVAQGLERLFVARQPVNRPQVVRVAVEVQGLAQNPG